MKRTIRKKKGALLQFRFRNLSQMLLMAGALLNSFGFDLGCGQSRSWN